MEVTKRYPLVSMSQGPGEIRCYNTLTRSHSWFDRVNCLRFNKNPEKRSQFYFLEKSYSSVIPIQKVLGEPEESTVYHCPAELSYSTWTSSAEQHPKPRLTFQALPDPSMFAENKPHDLHNISLLREITQKLLSICHLQHFCDLVCGLVNTVSAHSSTPMTSESNLCAANMSESFEKSTVTVGDLSGICESVTSVEVGFSTSSFQGDGQKSVAAMNRSMARITQTGNVKCSEFKSEKLGPIKSGNMTHMEVVTSSKVESNECIAKMNTQDCSNSPVREVKPRMKSKVKNVDEEMVSRKQRRINKHSKKRKRRIRKKEKSSSAHSLEKGGTDKKKTMNWNASSQMKCRNGLSMSAGSRNMFHDWDESDDDVCIVFEDEVDSSCRVVPDNVNAKIEESSDLWIEFDSLTIVSGNSSTLVGCTSYNSEISIECDSDSEYETDSGQIITDTDDFDSWPGLVLLSDSVDGCSSLSSQPYVHCTNFASGTTFELVNDCAEMYEINKKWRKVMSDVDGKPRLPQRVTFAPEEELVSVFPVDMIDRKSEWEQFAVERFRFKRRIDEFEKIIAPYLTSTYREKTFRRLLGDAAS